MKMNPAKENILLRKTVSVLQAEIATLPHVCCTRWVKIMFFTLQQMGYGEKRTADFMEKFFQVVDDIKDNDTWEEEMDRALEKNGIPQFDCAGVIAAGLKKEG